MLFSLTKGMPLRAWPPASQTLMRRGLALGRDKALAQPGSTPWPRRRRRGMNLLIVSGMSLAFVLGLTVYVQQMARTERTLRAGEVAFHLTALAGDLDFWVHYNRALVPDMLDGNVAVSIDAGDIMHPINNGPTATPYLARTRANWDIDYVILTIDGDALPYGVIVARPTSSRARTLSGRVATKISERANASQAIAALSPEDLRDLLNAADISLADPDLAFFSYSFNGLNPDYVLRQKFAGIPSTIMGADISFTDSPVSPRHSIAGVGKSVISDGVVGKITQGSSATFYVNTLTPANLQTSSHAFTIPGTLTVRGNLSTESFSQSTTVPHIFTTQRVIVAGAATTPALVTDSPSTVGVLNTQTITISGPLSGKATLDTGTIEAVDFALEQLELSGDLQTTDAQTDLSINGRVTARVTTTGRCTGC